MIGKLAGIFLFPSSPAVSFRKPNQIGHFAGDRFPVQLGMQKELTDLKDKNSDGVIIWLFYFLRDVTTIYFAGSNFAGSTRKVLFCVLHDPKSMCFVAILPRVVHRNRHIVYYLLPNVRAARRIFQGTSCMAHLPTKS